MRRLRWMLALVLAVSLLTMVAPAQAQSKTLVWERYDVFLNVLPNGDLRVTERQTINFTSGVFTFGFAIIPLEKMESITDISISEPNGPVYTEVGYGIDPRSFYVNEVGDELEVYWYFPPAVNETRTFDLSYTVRGAVRIYESGDKLQWIAIDGERDFPILNASVQVTIPEGASFQDIDSAGVRADWEQLDSGRSVRYVAQGSMGPSDVMEIGVEFTHGVLPSNVPAWQAAVDEQETYDLNVRPILNLGVGAVAAIIAIGGPLLVYLMWYLRGRDPAIGPVPDYVEVPPDDMPPGLLGSLIDEQADMQDVVATIVDLARRGYLRIEEKEGKGFFGLGSTDFTFVRTDKDDADLRKYERKVIQGIFTGSRTERKLSALRNKFYTKLPGIQEALYEELVSSGLFKRRPDRTRATWSGFGVVALVGAIIVGVLTVPLSTYAGLIPCLAVALGLGAISMLMVGRYMPAKTLQGAEATAKWNAFRNYLRRIEHLQDLQQAANLFEPYLPYAIAFGMNQSWVNKFARLSEAPAPGWYVPYPRHYSDSGDVGGGGGGLARSMPMGSGGRSGGLQGMSDSLGGGLQSMSDGLSTMLNSAGRVLGSAPSSSGSSGGGGGGFSGGGFSGGGGGGGGGRGFG